MSAQKETPLMKQYGSVKAKHPDAVLLFRLGDFYETFGDDAVITAKVCGITLTKRNNGAAGEIPLAGFPHHQLDVYLPKLVRGGYRVAVCEQLEDPKQAKGIVKRGVVEIVTPGVALYDRLLDSRKNNYVVSIFLSNDSTTVGIACGDITTGEFYASEVSKDSLLPVLESLAPSEVVVSRQQKASLESQIATLSSKPLLTRLEDWYFVVDFGKEQIAKMFQTRSVKSFGLEHQPSAIVSAGALLHYIEQTQQRIPLQFTSITSLQPDSYMVLDASTRRNLEILFSMHSNERDSSLFTVIDKTNTAMGARLLKKWVTRPLRSLEQIQKRLHCVRLLKEDYQQRKSLQGYLNDVGDIERIVTKICTGRVTPRDFTSLRSTLGVIPAIRTMLENFSSKPFTEILSAMPNLDKLHQLLAEAFVEEPAAVLGNGPVFRAGYSAELDKAEEALYSGKNWIADYQQRLRIETGISTLKVGVTSVFGYYIEISNAHKGKHPEYFIRKQTLTNAERFTTDELQSLEATITNAEYQFSSISNQLFETIRNHFVGFTMELQSTAYLLAILDCYQGFAELAESQNYVEPVMTEGEELEILNGRHPVVETLLPVGVRFVPNTTKFVPSVEEIHLITGPNMSGKSCYLRQVGLCVLLSHIGSFVPAERATIGVVDRIFTRVGAQDNVAAGESTFLVEMQEASTILANATKKSLILLDEVGRGTATFDGISIAWSIAEYIHERIGAKTLFATHYHELTELPALWKRMKNYKVEVQEVESSILFSHKVVEGTSDHSFGIHVAQMAGLPTIVLQRASELLQRLEQTKAQSDERPSTNSTKKGSTDQMSIFEFKDDELRTKLRSININAMTPIEAFSVLQDLIKQANKN